MKKTLFLLSLLTILAACGNGNSTSMSNSSMPSTSTSSSISNSTSNSTSAVALYNLRFSDAKNGEKYETMHGDWIIDAASSSYDGAIKLQYGRNSAQGKSNYLMSPMRNFQGEIKMEIDCYATISDAVITDNPFEFAVIGLDNDLNVVEEDTITSVLEMPNPSADNSETKTFHLKNDGNKIKRVKIELKTKLTSSNVGIKSIIVKGI